MSPEVPTGKIRPGVSERNDDKNKENPGRTPGKAIEQNGVAQRRRDIGEE